MGRHADVAELQMRRVGGGEQTANSACYVESRGQKTAGADGGEATSGLGGFAGVAAGGENKNGFSVDRIGECRQFPHLGIVEWVAAGAIDVDRCAGRRLGEGTGKGLCIGRRPEVSPDQARKRRQLLDTAGAMGVRRDHPDGAPDQGRPAPPVWRR